MKFIIYVKCLILLLYIVRCTSDNGSIVESNNERFDLKEFPQSSNSTYDEGTYTIKLIAFNIKYAANIPGNEWRATFQVNVADPNGFEMRTKIDDLEYYWIWDYDYPNWGTAISIQSSCSSSITGVFTLDGEWPTSPNNYVRMIKLRVILPQIGLDEYLIGNCGFVQPEGPPSRWSCSTDYELYSSGRKNTIDTETYNYSALPTYTCPQCDYTYYPYMGDPENGIDPLEEFVYLPDDWTCPDCGASKDSFEED